MSSFRQCRAWFVAIGSFVLLVSTGNLSAGNIDVGGWAGFVYSDNDKEGTIGGFDAHPWYFYLQGEPADGYRFFGEIEAEHVFQFEAGSRGAGELKLERLYMERNFSTAHNVRLGKFFLPFGYWYRLHWHFLTETLSRPFSFNNAYTPKFQVGIQYFGRTFTGDTDFNYYLWLGNGPDQFGTNKRTVEELAYGGSVFVTRKLGGARDNMIGAAVGFHAQTVDLGTMEEGQQNLVASIEARIRRLEIRGEFNHHDREESGDLSTWYANALVWVFPEIGGNYRLDWGDDLKNSGSGSNHEAISHSFGLLWRPEAQVLLKGEYRVNRFDDPDVVDFDEWNIFTALKF